MAPAAGARERARRRRQPPRPHPQPPPPRAAPTTSRPPRARPAPPAAGSAGHTAAVNERRARRRRGLTGFGAADRRTVGISTIVSAAARHRSAIVVLARRASRKVAEGRPQAQDLPRPASSRDRRDRRCRCSRRRLGRCSSRCRDRRRVRRTRRRVRRSSRSSSRARSPLDTLGVLAAAMANPYVKQYLMTAGPTPLPPAVSQVMAEPILYHRAPAFIEVYARCLERLKGSSRPRTTCSASRPRAPAAWSRPSPT